MMERTAERGAALVDELRNVVVQTGAMAQRASVAAEAYTHENPWTVVGGAAALGLILGALFTRSFSAGGNEVL